MVSSQEPYACRQNPRLCAPKRRGPENRRRLAMARFAGDPAENMATRLNSRAMLSIASVDSRDLEAEVGGVGADGDDR